MSNSNETKLISSIEMFVGTLGGSFLLTLAGIFPLFIYSTDDQQKTNRNEKNSWEFIRSLSVGSQLGEIFLHLFPQCYFQSNLSINQISLAILTGFFFFYFIEFLFINSSSSTKENSFKSRQIRGYLNLLANFLDNFSHGATIGGTFSLNHRIGCRTLFSMLIHEIPHEMTDFGILLHSGLNRSEATKAQLLTGSSSILSALLTLFYSQQYQYTSWIIPLTIGAFLYVSLVQTLSDLVKTSEINQTTKHFLGLFVGLIIIYFFNRFFDH